MAGYILYHCLWKTREQNDYIDDLKWSMLLELQTCIDYDRVHECFLLCRNNISVVFKECDEIYHLVRNE